MPVAVRVEPIAMCPDALGRNGKRPKGLHGIAVEVVQAKAPDLH